MTAIVEFVIFFSLITALSMLFFRVCKEGDYDDYD